MEKILYVGLGGAVGAILRYLISCLPNKGYFPYLTLMTNILGAIFIGVAVGMFEKDKMSSSMNLFLKTGVCGGFTTFSTFSLESFTLFETHQFIAGLSYVSISIVGCIVGVMIGKYISFKISL